MTNSQFKSHMKKYGSTMDSNLHSMALASVYQTLEHKNTNWLCDMLVELGASVRREALIKWVQHYFPITISKESPVRGSSESRPRDDRRRIIRVKTLFDKDTKELLSEPRWMEAERKPFFELSKEVAVITELDNDYILKTIERLSATIEDALSGSEKKAKLKSGADIIMFQEASQYITEMKAKLKANLDIAKVRKSSSHPMAMNT